MEQPTFPVHYMIVVNGQNRFACRTNKFLSGVSTLSPDEHVTCTRCRNTNRYQQDRYEASKPETVPQILGRQVIWQKVGQDLDVDPEAWMMAHIVICGVDMHLEAIWVVDDEENDGMQVAICPNLDEILNEYAQACRADGHFQTMYRGGHQYAIFATPFC
jgi:hypothetical protein